MAKHGRKYLEKAKLVDRTRAYSPQEAIELAKQTSFTNFDATVEAHLRLGVAPRHADQQVRGVVLLPHGTGKQVRILVFAEGEAEKIAFYKEYQSAVPKEYVSGENFCYLGRNYRLK
ncbi:MAG TPA: hypothetical protein EYP55_03610, partial [Anaerolineae bacterium]|nr:hypothetical protein [Anaerolineae bacterium]